MTAWVSAMDAAFLELSAGPALVFTPSSQRAVEARAYAGGGGPSVGLSVGTGVPGSGAVWLGLAARYRLVAYWSRPPSEGNIRSRHPITHDVDVLVRLGLGERGLGPRFGLGYTSSWLANPAHLYIKPEIAGPLTYDGFVVEGGYALGITPWLRVSGDVSLSTLSILDRGPRAGVHVSAVAALL